MANLIICCDGTWNNPEQEDNGIPAPTNVVKLYNAIANNAHQKKYYHPGLGGEDSGLKDAILDGALGVSIRRHISSAYHWLAKNYHLGDQVYIFGFSRGAFTARSLTGMLSFGLLDFTGLDDKKCWQRTHQLFDWYKNKEQPLPNNYFIDEGQAFNVRFLGVWDTVGALGIPNDLEFFNLFDDPDRWRFHDTNLGNNVLVARHAMAMDEIRSSFTVTRWENADDHPNVQEKWFPGVHSDVGGGYADHSLSDIALQWMMEEAQAQQLVFRENVFNQLRPNPAGALHNSFKGVFKKLRSRPRNIDAVNEENTKYFHQSIFQRQIISPIEHPEYWPTKQLSVNETLSFNVFAKEHWSRSYLYMSKGEKYVFSAKGNWQDSKDTCNWLGTDDGKLTTGDIIRSISSLWGITERKYKQLSHNKTADFWGTKRVEKFNWFIAVGCIANDSGEELSVDNDGSPAPHQYVALPEHAKAVNALEIEKSGYFYAFPNDVWSLFDNNHGSIELSIKRIA